MALRAGDDEDDDIIRDDDGRGGGEFVGISGVLMKNTETKQ